MRLPENTQSTHLRTDERDTGFFLQQDESGRVEVAQRRGARLNTR